LSQLSGVTEGIKTPLPIHQKYGTDVTFTPGKIQIFLKAAYVTLHDQTNPASRAQSPLGETSLSMELVRIGNLSRATVRQTKG
jgi:hypothetical protein